MSGCRPNRFPALYSIPLLEHRTTVNIQYMPPSVATDSRHNRMLGDGLESMKLGLMAALWLLVASMAGRLFQSLGILDDSIFKGLLGTVFRSLGMA